MCLEDRFFGHRFILHSFVETINSATFYHFIYKKVCIDELSLAQSCVYNVYYSIVLLYIRQTDKLTFESFWLSLHIKSIGDWHYCVKKRSSPWSLVFFLTLRILKKIILIICFVIYMHCDGRRDYLLNKNDQCKHFQRPPTLVDTTLSFLFNFFKYAI